MLLLILQTLRIFISYDVIQNKRTPLAGKLSGLFQCLKQKFLQVLQTIRVLIADLDQIRYKVGLACTFMNMLY